MWEQRRHPLAGLAVPVELPLGTDHATAVAMTAAAVRLDTAHGLPVQFIELRLRVEGLHLAGAAVHEQEDARLGLGREVRRLGSERVDGRLVERAGKESVPRKETGHGQGREACAQGVDELAARAGEVFAQHGSRSVHEQELVEVQHDQAELLQGLVGVGRIREGL